MPQDRIKTIGRSRIQYGPLSDRVYLMQLAAGEAEAVITAMAELAQAEGYTKLFAKIPGKNAAVFEDAGFEIEAQIPDFFADGDKALFVSRFICKNRRRSCDAERIQKVLEASLQRAGNGIRHPLPSDFDLTFMTADRAEQMAALYSQVFDSYPFPIFDADYIRHSMDENFRYFGILQNATLIALASAERIESGGGDDRFCNGPQTSARQPCRSPAGCHGSRRPAKRRENGLYHCPRCLLRHQHHVRPGRLHLRRDPGQQYQYLRSCAEHEHLVQASRTVPLEWLKKHPLP